MIKIKENVTTLPGSLGVNPYQWTPAHRDVPPEWLSQEGTPCMCGGKAGKMQVVNGKLVCVVNPAPKESTNMDDEVITEATTLRFSSPSRVQIAKCQVYWDIHRRQKGLGVVKVGPIEGTDGNWYFDVSSHSDNQFLTTSRMNNILPGNVTVTSGGPVVVQHNASQNSDTARNAIREMVENKLNQLNENVDTGEVVSVLENINHDDLKSMGYTHTGTNEYGLGGKRDHHFTHPDDITKDTIKKLHSYLAPLGYRKDKGGGLAQTAWSKDSHRYAFITRRLVGTRIEGHKLQISEPK